MDANEREEMRMDIDGPDLESAAPVQEDSRELPFPKLSPDGFVETQYLTIHPLRRAQLVDLCRQFQIVHSGLNMATLRTRLEDFSGRQDLWDRLKVGARRAHLGPRSTKNENKTVTQKRSTKQREILFKDNPAAARKPLTTLAATGQQTGWNEARHKADMDWAIRISNKYPYYPEETRLQLAACDAERLSSRATRDSLVKQSIENTNVQLTKILEHITSSPSHPIGAPAANCTALNTLSDDPTSKQLQPFSAVSTSDATTPNGPCPIPAPSPAALSVPFAQDQSMAQPIRSLVLGDGRKLVFTVDDVPSPRRSEAEPKARLSEAKGQVRGLGRPHPHFRSFKALQVLSKYAKKAN